MARRKRNTLLRRWAARGFAVLVGLVAPLGLMELGARLYDRLRTAEYPLNEWTYLAQRPPPYAEADYFSAEFVEEARTCLRRSRRPAQAAGSSLLGSFTGKHIRIVDGFRTTTDRPPRADARVLVFGGSTVFSRNVPDALTIPSHLQRLLRAGSRRSYAVTNLGQPGDTIQLQSWRLLATRLEEGDVVIFYDGANDVFNPVYSHRRGRRSSDPGIVGRQGARQRHYEELGLFLGRYSSAARLLFNLGFDRGAAGIEGGGGSGPVLPRGFADDAELMRVLESIAERYRTTLLASNRYVSEHGGSFHHFLQPNLYVQEKRSAHERRVMRREHKLYPGLEHAMRLGYPKLREAMRAAREESVSSVDLSGVLADRPGGGEVYFDRVHVNHVANEIVARRIFTAVFAADPDRGEPPSRR